MGGDGLLRRFAVAAAERNTSLVREIAGGCIRIVGAADPTVSILLKHHKEGIRA